MIFASKHLNLAIWIGKKKIQFKNGLFTTEDEKLIKQLKDHPNCRNVGIGSFVIGAIEKDKASKVNRGARGTYTEAEQADLKAKFKEYDKLKSEIVKADGTFRADATEESKVKLAELKKEIGL